MRRSTLNKRCLQHHFDAGRAGVYRHPHPRHRNLSDPSLSETSIYTVDNLKESQVSALSPVDRGLQRSKVTNAANDDHCVTFRRYASSIAQYPLPVQA